MDIGSFVVVTFLWTILSGAVLYAITILIKQCCCNNKKSKTEDYPDPLTVDRLR